MVKVPAILDSACLIGLERVNLLDLLPKLLEPLIAPPAVIAEFGSCPGWLAVVTPQDAGMVAALRLVVDAGESEAIALAYEQKRRIILDDRKAREAIGRFDFNFQLSTFQLFLLCRFRVSALLSSARSISLCGKSLFRAPLSALRVWMSLETPNTRPTLNHGQFE